MVVIEGAPFIYGKLKLYEKGPLQNEKLQRSFFRFSAEAGNLEKEKDMEFSTNQ